jgi:uncharacterized membrane protein
MSNLRYSAAAPPHYADPRPSGSAVVNVGDAERAASAAGGAILAAYGLKRGGLGGLLLAGIGGALLYRGSTGHCPAFAALGASTAPPHTDSIYDPPADGVRPVEIIESLTVAADRLAAYGAWRDFERFPLFMEHVVQVLDFGDGCSEWTAQFPGISNVKWDAELVEDRPGEVLAWRSKPGAQVDNSGHVRFEDAPTGGTEVHVRIAYRPPAGQLGAAVAGLFNDAFARMVKEDVRRFKHLIETGGLPTTQGQPQGDDD